MYFSIEPMGNFGNRMLEYMVALAVGRHFPQPLSLNCQLPEIGLEFDRNLHDQLLADEAKTYVVKDRDVTSISALVENIKKSGATAVVFQGFFQRYELYEKAEFYRDFVFKKQPLDIAPFGENDLVINIRAGEILGGGVSWYPLVPVNFYETLISRTKCNPVFLGQIQDCEYIREIQKAFPDARMIPSGGAITDFNRLLHAKRICITVSTFSWLAAWLSTATEIHYPLLGFLHPFCLPKGTHGNGGIDLTPLGDPRYRYHLFPILNAEPEGEYLRFTKTLNPISQAVSEQFVDELCQKSRTNYQTINTAKNKHYLKKYPDAAWSVSSGRADSALAHYENIGKIHGYSLFDTPPRPPLENVALHKSATQSSISTWSIGKTPEADASGAVDGVIDGFYSFHTALEDAPWWRVDLGGTCTISEIRVFNRVEHEELARRANRIAIDIGNNEDGYREAFRYESETPFGGSDGKPLIFKPGEPIHGRFVRIRLRTRNCLHLEQVEIYGE